jgi:porphobilinogen synthase
MLRRPRRNRQSSAIRAMVEETTVSVNDLIYPMFVMEGQNLTTEVKSMPGIFRYSLDKLLDELAVIQDLGIRSIALFPQIPEAKKDKYATESHRQGNIYLESINAIKNAFPEICIMSDVAMDPYSADGHDGIVENGQILNDESLEVLAKMAVAQAEAGADIVDHRI